MNSDVRDKASLIAGVDCQCIKSEMIPLFFTGQGKHSICNLPAE
jgi:hypothetical protein